MSIYLFHCYSPLRCDCLEASAAGVTTVDQTNTRSRHFYPSRVEGSNKSDATEAEMSQEEWRSLI